MPDASVEARDDTAEAVRSAMRGVVVLLYDELPWTVGAIAILALFLCIPAFIHVADRGIAWWTLAPYAIQSSLLAIHVAFSRRVHAPFDSERWLRLLRWTFFGNGLGWGLAFLVFGSIAEGTSALSLLAMTSIVVVGIRGCRRDVTAMGLWTLPSVAPLPLLMARGSDTPAKVAALCALVVVVIHFLFSLREAKTEQKERMEQTERSALIRRLEERILLTHAASMERSHFVAAAIHDLKQPLQALNFFGSTLDGRLANPPDQAILRSLMHSVGTLDRSFDAILEMFHLDSQRVQQHPQLFALRDLFRRLQMSFGGEAESANLQLRFKPGGLIIKSDPQLLERILTNLIQNALRYCPSGGVIVVGRRWKNGTNIEVWDTGIGIPREEIPKIFTDFYQVAFPGRARGVGLGIGLAIVSRLAALLGHSLSVESQVGKGTVFKVWIPASDLPEMDEFAIGSDTLPPRIDGA